MAYQSAARSIGVRRPYGKNGASAPSDGAALLSVSGRPPRKGTQPSACTFPVPNGNEEVAMNAIIYLVGLVVVVMFILSVVGLR